MIFTEIVSTAQAFAGLKSDGSVITWGDSGYGGDSSSVASELSNGVKNFFLRAKIFALGLIFFIFLKCLCPIDPSPNIKIFIYSLYLFTSFLKNK